MKEDERVIKLVCFLMLIFKIGLAQDTFFVSNNFEGQYRYFEYRDSLERYKYRLHSYLILKKYNGQTFNGTENNNNAPSELKEIIADGGMSCAPSRAEVVVNLFRCKGCIPEIIQYEARNPIYLKPKIVIAEKKSPTLKKEKYRELKLLSYNEIPTLTYATTDSVSMRIKIKRKNTPY